METLNTIECQNVVNEIGKHVKIKRVSQSNNLWFIYIENPFAGKAFRDDDKNLWNIYNQDIMMKIDCGINPNGVGDGKEPKIAMTYAMGWEITGNVRMYKRKNWWIGDCYRHFYTYSRELNVMVDRIVDSLKKEKII